MSDDTKQWPLVAENDGGIRPAGAPDRCFYCRQQVGQPHARQCVMVTKKVRIRATIEYEEQIPFNWNKEAIEFHHNKGSWCSDNFVEDLLGIVEKQSPSGCACQMIRFEYLSEDDTPTRELRDEKPDQTKN